MKAYIITGASRGLGAELAKGLAGKETVIIALSRSRNIQVERAAEEAGAQVVWHEIDLSDIDNLIKNAAELFPLPFKIGKLTEIALINNAAAVEPIGFAGDFDTKKAAATISLNFTAVAVLSSFFISTYRGLPAVKKILNITSGASDYVIQGASIYSATKAAVDMFTRTTAEEQKAREHPVICAAISPGMVNTDMQERLRKASPGRLPGREYYSQALESGEVHTPAAAAGKVLDFLRSDFESGTVTHI